MRAAYDIVLSAYLDNGSVGICTFSQAGARLHQVVDALAPHGLTLQNYTAINVQQLGGLLQVSDAILFAAPAGELKLE